MIKLNEEGMPKARRGWTLGPSPQTVNQAANSKLKFLKEIKHKHRKDKKAKKPYCWYGEIWIKNQASYNIPGSQSLIQRQTLTIFNYLKGERVKEATEERFEAGRGRYMRFKKRSYL